MFALEKKIKGKWRRYVVCQKRNLLDQVREALNKTETWRVIFDPSAALVNSRHDKAA